jgi:hypothetical protein
VVKEVTMFHNRIIEDYGIPLTSQKIVPGNTRTAVSAGGYQYVERTLAFTSGGTTEVKVGDIICQTGINAVVTAISALTAGTSWAAGTAAGTFTIKNQIGTFAAGAIYVGAGSDEATIAGNSTVVATDYRFKNALAKVAVVQALTQSALITFDGSTPDQTLLKGWTLAAGQSIVVLEEAIQRIQVVDRVASSASTVFIQYYF